MATSEPYTRTARALHWSLAVGLTAQLVLGWWMLGLPRWPTGLRAQWFNLHKSIGLSLLALVLVRLAWRLAHPVRVTHALPGWQPHAALWTHRLLYACMLIIPVSGYLGSSFSGYPVRLFEAVLPGWSGAWPAGKQFMSLLHHGAVCLFMGLVTAHVAAGLRHWMRGDAVAGRMGLPLRPRAAP